MGDLVRPLYYNLGRDQLILHMGIGAIDSRADFKTLFLSGRQHPLCLPAFVGVDDGDPAIPNDEILDGFGILGAVWSLFVSKIDDPFLP